MKRRFTLLIAMVMLLTAMATNVFASSANNNSKVSPKEWQEWFNGLSKEEQLSVNYEPSQVLKALSANEVSKVNIDDKYETKTFLTELQNLYPTMEKKSINQYISSYIEIFNMYRGMYPNLSNKAIAEKAKANMLNKIEYMIDDSEYEAKDIIIRSTKEPDGYEAIVDYINKNLKPNYYATLDTTEENINILKRHINSLPNEVKESALLYIEDMESEDNFDETIAKKYLKTNILYRSSEKDAASKCVAYAKKYWKDYNPSYPDWDVDCANFVSQCLYAGEKKMKHEYPKIDDSRNWFSYGSKKEPSQVSSTWRGANMFKWHWVSRSYAYKDFDLSKNGELSRLYNYAQAGYPISFLNSKDSAYHTLIITGFNNNTKDVGVRNHSGRVNNENTGVRWLSGDNVKVRVYVVYKL